MSEQLGVPVETISPKESSSKEVDPAFHYDDLDETSRKAFISLKNSLNAEGVPAHLSPEQKSAVGSMLEAWACAAEAYDNCLKRPKQGEWTIDYDMGDSWGQAVYEQNWRISVLLNPGVLARYNTILSTQIPEHLAKDTTPLLEELLTDPSFSQRSLFANYLIHRVKFPSPDALPGEHDKLLQVLRKGALASAQLGDEQTIGKIFACYRDTKDVELAQATLVEALTVSETSDDVMVPFINKFGYIQAIDTIATAIKHLEETGHAPEQLSKLKQAYGDYQGDKVEDIQACLSDVYKAVDFSEYALNSEQLTKLEVDLIEEYVLKPAAEAWGIPTKKVKFLDLAAGTGRHTAELAKRGYKNVIDLEYEPQHVLKIKQGTPEAMAVQGSWLDMPFVDAPDDYLVEDPEEVICGFACLGRSIHHARTPNEMLKVFDELQRVTTFPAYGVIDVGREVGKYGEAMARFKQNLEEKGIDPIHAKLIFDGPDNEHKFNRMLLSDEQFRTYAALTGFEVVDVLERDIDGVKNVYYIVQKSENFDPARYYFSSSHQTSEVDFVNMLRDIGLFDPGMNLDMYVDAWEMTIAQALYRNSSGQLSNVEVSIDDDTGTIYFGEHKLF